MLGYENEKELIGKSAVEVYANPDQRIKVFKELIEKGSITNLELEIKKKDGSIVHTLSSVTTQTDKTGKMLK